jgi:ABC-type phosphate transport system substrate-binding protein
MKVKIKLLGLLAMCLAAAFATSGIAAGTAAATTTCETTSIEGQGSSLQKLAQETLWIPGSKCKVKYSSTGSGAGRKAFGEEKAGETLNTADTYIATDEPLGEAQLKNGDEAAKGKFSIEDTGGEGQTIVIPVEQAAVAVIVNPPEKCKLEAITNKNLWELWNGTITEWSQITGKIKTGEGGVTEEESGKCKKKITRFVRKDVSGTTFVFKTYLSEIERIQSLTKACGKKWSELAKPENNKVWPKSGSETCTGLSPVFEAETEGGSGEVKEVVEEKQGTKEGSIGYANLADARKEFTGTNRYTWVKVENESLKKGVYPGSKNANSGKEPTKEKGQSNCEGTSYGSQPKVTIDDNWSAVNGANPGNGADANTNYSICTLTYDVAFANYSKAGYGTESANLQTATKEYLTYVVGAGQANLEKNDYLKVEEAVSTKAKELVEKI